MQSSKRAVFTSCVLSLRTSRNPLKHADDGPSIRSTNSAVSLNGADSTAQQTDNKQKYARHKHIKTRDARVEWTSHFDSRSSGIKAVVSRGQNASMTTPPNTRARSRPRPRKSSTSRNNTRSDRTRSIACRLHLTLRGPQVPRGTLQPHVSPVSYVHAHSRVCRVHKKKEKKKGQGKEKKGKERLK